MIGLSDLMNRITPGWLRRSSPRGRKASAPLPEDADAVWRELAEKDLFGTNTSDYTLEPKEERGRRHPH